MKNLIGKEWVDSVSGVTIDVINPANGKLIDTVPSATSEDVDLAVKAAVEAQVEWARVPIHERAQILENFVNITIEHANDLAELLCCETGKPIKEARAEIANIPIFFKGYAEKAKHLYGEVLPIGGEKGQEHTIQFTVREPLGVVACILPFNFPVDLFGQKVPSALVMGNAVIVKPSSDNPLTIHALCGFLQEAGIPSGIIQVITGSGSVVGQALAAHKNVHLVSLTGSTKAGMETMATASANMTHVSLELGGNDAFIMLDDGDMDLAVNETVWGRLYNTGQVCCASKRFLIHNSIKYEFVDRMVSKIKGLKVGNPSDESTDIGCLINEQAAITVEEQVNKTIAEGAKLVIGGKRDGAFYYPTILTDVTRDMEIAKDMEVFGPVIPVIGFDTIDEALEIANQSSYGLCGCVITEDMKKAFYVATSLEAGGAIINGASFYRSAEMPFGGYKHSGIGNEGISTTLEEMSRLKTIVLKNVLKND